MSSADIKSFAMVNAPQRNIYTRHGGPADLPTPLYWPSDNWIITGWSGSAGKKATTYINTIPFNQYCKKVKFMSVQTQSTKSDQHFFFLVTLGQSNFCIVPYIFLGTIIATQSPYNHSQSKQYLYKHCHLSTEWWPSYTHHSPNTLQGKGYKIQHCKLS